MNDLLRAVIGVSLCVSASLLTGCTLPGDSTPKPAATPKENSPSTSPATPSGQSPAPSGKEAEPPAGSTTSKGPARLPTDVPFYSGGTITSEAANGDSYVLTYTAPTASKTVSSFYESELKKQGWSVKAATSVEVPFLGTSVAPMVAEKTDRTCSVTISGKNDSECTVVLVVGTKQTSK